jgi:hypothetical protein
MSIMQPTQKLVDAMYRERVLRARAMPQADKAIAGARLFDHACSITMAGIRHQHPDADEQQVVQIMRQRLLMRKRQENSGDK